MTRDSEVPREPGPARRLGGRSARVRAAVLQAAADALVERGLDGFTVADVAARAGVHETSIYRRWTTRLNLAADALLDREQEEITAPDTGTLRGDLLELMRGIAAFMQTPLGETLAQIATRRDVPELEAVRHRFWDARVAFGAVVLDRAVARGELRPGLDQRIVLETLIAPVHLRLLLTREPLDEPLFTEVVDLLLAGIEER